MRHWPLAAASALVLIGCPQEERRVSAPGVDGGVRVDAGPGDSGPVDSGVADSGPSDAGPSDSGPVDSGPPATDAGVTDSGPADSGPADGGPVAAHCARFKDAIGNWFSDCFGGAPNLIYDALFANNDP